MHGVRDSAQTGVNKKILAPRNFHSVSLRPLQTKESGNTVSISRTGNGDICLKLLLLSLLLLLWQEHPLGPAKWLCSGNLSARFWVRKQVVNAFLLDTSVEVSAATLTGGA